MQHSKLGKIQKILSILIVVLVEVLAIGNINFLKANASDSCGNYSIFYLRDIGEPLNSASFLEFKHQLSHELDYNTNFSYNIEELNFDATDYTDFYSNFTTSAPISADNIHHYNLALKNGEEALTAKINSFTTSCPDTHIILTGYSLGSDIIKHTLASLDDTSKSRIFYVASFGDLDTTSSSTAQISGVEALFFCNYGDIFCSNTGDSLSSHFSYATSGIFREASILITSKITTLNSRSRSNATTRYYPRKNIAILVNVSQSMIPHETQWKEAITSIESTVYSFEGNDYGFYTYFDVHTNDIRFSPRASLGRKNNKTISYLAQSLDYIDDVDNPSSASLLYAIFTALNDTWTDSAEKHIIVYTANTYYEDDHCYPAGQNCVLHYDDIVATLVEKNIHVHIVADKNSLRSTYSDIITKTNGSFHLLDDYAVLTDSLTEYSSIALPRERYIAEVGKPFNLIFEYQGIASLRGIEIDFDGDGIYEIIDQPNSEDILKPFIYTTTFDSPSDTHDFTVRIKNSKDKYSAPVTAKLTVVPANTTPDFSIENLTYADLPNNSIQLNIEDSQNSDHYLILINDVPSGYSDQKTIQVSNLDRSVENTITIIPIRNQQKGLPTSITIPILSGKGGSEPENPEPENPEPENPEPKEPKPENPEPEEPEPEELAPKDLDSLVPEKSKPETPKKELPLVPRTPNTGKVSD